MSTNNLHGLDRMRDLMKLEKSLSETQINEGFWDRLKGGGSPVRDDKNHPAFREILSLYKQAQRVLDRVYSEMEKSQKLFNQLESAKNKINSLSVDQHIKERWTDLVNGLKTTQGEIFDAITKHDSGESTYDAGQQAVGQQNQQQSSQTSSFGGWDQDDEEPQPGYQSGLHAQDQDEEEPETQQAKVVDINDPRFRQEVTEFLQNRKQNIAESVLNEVKKEGKFDEAMKTLYMNAERMIKSGAIQNMNHAALAKILKLALASILTKGQAAFINDIKDINNGYNIYRNAHKDLMNTETNAKSQDTKQPEPQTANEPEQGPDRTQEARDAAKDFLNQYGYKYDMENITKAAEYIMRHPDF